MGQTGRKRIRKVVEVDEAVDDAGTQRTGRIGNMFFRVEIGERGRCVGHWNPLGYRLQIADYPMKGVEMEGRVKGLDKKLEQILFDGVKVKPATTLPTVSSGYTTAFTINYFF